MKTERALLCKLVGLEKAEVIFANLDAKGLPPEAQEEVLVTLIQQIVCAESPGLSDFLKYKVKPVSVQEFMISKFYLGKAGEVYPTVMSELIELNSGDYDEAVLTGGIGSGKTTVALYTQAYQLYLLSCLRSPHKLFDLDSSSEIKVIFQSLKEKLAKAVDYDRFRAMIEKSPYFQRHFMFNTELQSKLEFPHRIQVEPVSGSETASIGQNVIGGVIDEINFMAVVEKSKQAADGGTYDQAIELYNTIARRRKSRFMKAGRMPGLLCLVSSKKTPGQFTDKKEEEAKHNPRIFVYDKRVWDIKPKHYSGRRFRVFIGNEGRKPRLIDDNEVIPAADKHLIDEIPVEFRQEFNDDITKALRDIAGKSTLAIHPFLPDTEKVVANFGKVQSVIREPAIDFTTVQPTARKSAITNTQFPRFCHLDLSLTGDHCGLSIGHVPEFITLQREGFKEMLPKIVMDVVLEIRPPKAGEIEFERVRRILYSLRSMGLPIKWVTMDSFQSADTMQILRTKGFITGYQSLDTTMVPYQITKAALYDCRCWMPEHTTARRELLTLERDFKKGKIDHTEHGSKDVADSIGGVVYGLTMRKEIWVMHGVRPQDSPSVYADIQAKTEEADKQHSGEGKKTFVSLEA